MSKELIIGVVLIIGAYLTLLINVIFASRQVDKYHGENPAPEDDINSAEG